MKASAIVLCGGLGRRVGGAEKALLELAEVPIIARISRELAPWPVLISANRELDSYARYGSTVRDGAFEGPLAGLLAALERLQTDEVFVCPGDCPGISRELAERLLRALEPNGVATCAYDGTRRQPLHLALRREVQGPLLEYLESGGRSVRGWLDAIGPVSVDCSDLPLAFDDVDELKDLERWRARLS